MRAVEAVGLRQRYGTRTALGPLDLDETGEAVVEAATAVAHALS